MRQKLYAIICAILLAVLLSACGGNVDGGNVDGVKTHQVDSKIYSQEEISAAICTIENEFKRSWKGCTLTEIYYAGDERNAQFQQWRDAEEVIVLLSSFDVDSSGGDGSLNPDSAYDNWNWILVRTDGGEWRHIDHGY